MIPNSQGSLTIRNARIFDGESPALIEGSIIVRDGRVTAVGTTDEGTGAGNIVDAGGRVVIPGLIDAHFHAYALSLTSAINETGPLSYSALAGARRLEAALGRGFTSVRDVAGGDVGLATAIEEGLYPGPRYFYRSGAEPDRRSR